MLFMKLSITGNNYVLRQVGEDFDKSCSGVVKYKRATAFVAVALS